MKNFFRNSFRIFSVLLMAAFVSCSQDGDGNVVLPPVPVKGTGNYIKVVRSGEPTINYVAFRIGNESTYAEYECTLREDDDFSIYYGCSDITNYESGIYVKPEIEKIGKNGRYAAKLKFTAGGKEFTIYLFSYSEGETFSDYIKIAIDGIPEKTIDVYDQLKYTHGRNAGNFTVNGVNSEMLALGSSELKSKIAVSAGKRDKTSGSVQWTQIDDFEVKTATGKIALMFHYGNSTYQINLSKPE